MRILIADDNPLTLRYLAEALGQLGHACATAENGSAALALAQARRFDLLLLDQRMPDLDGAAALQRLRADATAASQHAPAFATTAETDADLERGLQDQGFERLLRKPTDLTALSQALQGLATSFVRVEEPAVDYASAPLLDDAAACRSLGSAETAAALRQLFRSELEALPAELDACVANGDCAALRERLHRLCASAGFCGATRLELACRRLRASLAEATAVDPAHIEELRTAAQQTLQALPGA